MACITLRINYLAQSVTLLLYLLIVVGMNSRMVENKSLSNISNRKKIILYLVQIGYERPAV